MLLDYGALLLMISFPHTAQAQHGSYFDGIEMPRIGKPNHLKKRKSAMRKILY